MPEEREDVPRWRDATSPRDFFIICLPWGVWLALIAFQAVAVKPEPPPPALLAEVQQPQQGGLAAGSEGEQERLGRTVVVILDSLRQESIDEHMPRLKALERQHAHRAVRTCSANFTLVCVQTMLEGRESPFVASLHNFTGTQGSLMSLPGALSRQRRSLKMVSDYTLDSLYGRMARDSINVEGWPGDHLEHDLRALKVAASWLAHQDADVLFVHLIGTDKAAHRYNPGSPKYAEHFEAVDEALMRFIEALDPERDHLLVTGDHGHDEEGHHRKTSLVIARGPVLEPLLKASPEGEPIEQVELAYLMAVAAETSLHLDYEGRYFGLEPGQGWPPESSQAARRLDEFRDDQIEAMRRAGYQGESFEALRRAKDRARAERPWRALARLSPLLLLYFLWLTLIAASWHDPARFPARLKATLVFCALGVGTWLLGAWLSPWLMALLSVGMLGGALYAFLHTSFRRVWRLGATLWCVLLAAAMIGLIGAEWREWFHSRGVFIIQVPLFFTGMIACGALLSRVYSGSWWRAMPTTCTLLTMCALPSGVYYYQFGRNITQGGLIGAGVWALVALAVYRRQALGWVVARAKAAPIEATVTGALAAAIAGIVAWQRGSSWLWSSGLKRWLDLERPELAPWALLALAAAFVWSVRATRWRIVAGLNLALIFGYGIGLAELSASLVASVLAVALALALALRLEALCVPRRLQVEGVEANRAASLIDEQIGVWAAAVMLMTGWTMLQGFFIENVAFNFTFDYVSGLKLERDVALVSGALTFLKYAPLLWLPAIALMDRHAGAWRLSLKIALWALHLKMLALLVQIAFGAVNATQKLHELATSDLLFVLGIVLHLLVGLSVLTACAARRDPATAPVVEREEMV